MWCYSVSVKLVHLLNSPKHFSTPSTDCRGSNRGLFIGLVAFVCVLVSLIMFFVLVQQNPTASALTLHTAEASLHLITVVAMVIAAILVRPLQFSSKTSMGASLNITLLWFGMLGALTYLSTNAVAGALTIQEQEPLQGILLTISCSTGIVQTLFQTVFLACCLCRRPANAHQAAQKPGREFVTFLLVCSVVMWGLAGFELPRHQLSSLAPQVYGPAAWLTVTNLSLPLLLFYRFQALVCYASIWRKMYICPKSDFELEEHHL